MRESCGDFDLDDILGTLQGKVVWSFVRRACLREVVGIVVGTEGAAYVLQEGGFTSRVHPHSYW